MRADVGGCCCEDVLGLGGEDGVSGRLVGGVKVPSAPVPCCKEIEELLRLASISRILQVASKPFITGIEISVIRSVSQIRWRGPSQSSRAGL